MGLSYDDLRPKRHTIEWETDESNKFRVYKNISPKLKTKISFQVKKRKSKYKKCYKN